MNKTFVLFATLLLTSSSSLLNADAVASNLKTHVQTYRGNILAAAEKLPEADYAFRPTPDVMSVHEMLGHLTDANYSICAQLTGEANPDAGGNVKRNATKSTTIAALAKSFDYCMSAIDAADGKWEQQTKARVARDKAWVALHLLDHTALHYGNLITYMRMKGIVPPETERRLQAAPTKK